MPQDWRTTLYLPGLLEKAIRVRAKEFYYWSLSPFFTELVCFDLRNRVPHVVTQPLSVEPRAVQDAIDREIIRNYVPRTPRNYCLLDRLLAQLTAAGHLGEWLNQSASEIPFERPPENPETKPHDGPASKFPVGVRFPARLRSIIEIRWAELNYASLPEYVAGLTRYDLMLGGPHTYFNGRDKQRYLLDSLDIETELTFHARTKRRRILLDYMIEEAMGRPMRDDERHEVMLALAQRLRAVALGGKRASDIANRQRFEKISANEGSLTKY